MIVHRNVVRFGMAALVACLAHSSVAVAEKPKRPAEPPALVVNVYSALRVEDDRTPAASCTHAYHVTGNQQQVSCVARTKIEATGFVQKPGNILCGDRALKEPVAACISHYKLKEQFKAKGVGKEICMVWIFGRSQHPTVKGGITQSIREFNCAQMPTKDTWNGNMTPWVIN
ncbi:MAG TPA: hypothetical protein VGO52_22880 [Hyphomonadaceae bacterium]|jgi:hypothetical protein|nr:hypothetical protein [Hyphomonadaceae bacterium]